MVSFLLAFYSTGFNNPPGLDLLESLELGHRHEDDDSLLSSGAVNLLSGGDVELPEGGLQVAVDLKVQEGLADLLLDLIRLLIIRLDNFTTGESHTSEIINDVRTSRCLY